MIPSKIWAELPNGYGWITAGADGAYKAWCFKPWYLEYEGIWYCNLDKGKPILTEELSKNIFYAERPKGGSK